MGDIVTIVPNLMMFRAVGKEGDGQEHTSKGRAEGLPLYEDPQAGPTTNASDQFFTRKRVTTFDVIRETALSTKRHGTQVIDPTEKTAPPVGVW